METLRKQRRRGCEGEEHVLQGMQVSLSLRGTSEFRGVPVASGFVVLNNICI